jgi:hypothetical protein
MKKIKLGIEKLIDAGLVIVAALLIYQLFI